MNPSTHCLVTLILTASTAMAAEELPPPAATEQWDPVPPVVAAPESGAPSDATMLFDGGSVDAWQSTEGGAPAWKIEDGALVVVPKTGGIRTKAALGDIQLHLEFRAPAGDTGTGQGRGNSGVMLMGLYELQVLDSWKNGTYVNGQAGSIYKQHPPLANASRPPGEWQSFDIVFIAPRFSEAGELISPARITAFHNGVLVQHDSVLRGGTVYRGEPKYTPHAPKLPIELQNHGDAVAFRNIWVRELSLPAQ
jgi:hypothetical protein